MAKLLKKSRPKFDSMNSAHGHNFDLTFMNKSDLIFTSSKGVFLYTATGEIKLSENGQYYECLCLSDNIALVNSVEIHSNKVLVETIAVKIDPNNRILRKKEGFQFFRDQIHIVKGER